jgi:phosphopantothenoylcysteine decarboxylase/phosphopantothenate--cysteine ligase
VLITAGPTREAIDPVRFLSNASTGTMGIELAREALARGATVDLILGPTDVVPPAGAHVERVTTAVEMERATLARANGATIAIATAAVADWRPAETHASKVKKTGGVQTLALERNPDILAALGERKNGMFLVGFAAETDAHEANAREKLARKHLDAIAVNDVAGGRGFGTGENSYVVLWGEKGRRALPAGSKRVLAGSLWDAIVTIRSEARD